MPRDLSGRTVLVTGATGFIGGRLLEMLTSKGADVRAFVTSYARTARIARFDIRMVKGDITHREDARRATEGCAVVFHCAYGNRGDERRQREVNVEGTRNVLAASRDAGVERVVHVSSLAVYGTPADGELDEAAPRRNPGTPYGQSKLEAEKLAAEYARNGLPVVTVQPTVVYGPFGSVWTRRILEKMKSRRLVLVDGGEGLCNAVYIDDVVNALLLAGTRRGIEGEAFLISGPAPATWADFYGAFEGMLGYRSTVSLTWAQARAHAAGGRRRRGGFLRALRVLARQPELRRAIRNTRGGATAGRVARAILAPAIRPSPGGGPGGPEGRRGPRLSGSRAEKRDRPVQQLDRYQVELLRARPRVQIDKARRLLGYEPRFDLAAGMSLTEAWARWANLLEVEEL